MIREKKLGMNQIPTIKTYNTISQRLKIKQHLIEIDQTNNRRENPKRDVTHFESPPRRRLREDEDAILKYVHEGKSHLLTLSGSRGRSYR